MRHLSLNTRGVASPLLFVLLFLPGLISCGSLSSESGSSGGQNVMIDWVNSLRFHGITYLATSIRPQDGLPPGKLGPLFGTVKFKLDGNVHDPNYQMKDGDSAYLAAGTPVYIVKGYKPTFRLAAHFAGHIQLYEVDTNLQARTGADLLDIGRKVRFIGINSGQDGVTQLGAIKDLHKVTSMVNMILASPIDANWIGQETLTYFVDFHLLDGTSILRAYWLDAGVMQRGILLPKAFGDAIRQAIVK